MRPKILSIAFLVVITLAIVGFGTNLILNPMNLFKTLLIGLGIAALLFLALRFFQNRRNFVSSDEMKKYKAAVKQSKQIHNKQTVKPSSFRVIKKTKRRKTPSHLTVIQGKKSNDKS